jgi:hypothetical protein
MEESMSRIVSAFVAGLLTVAAAGAAHAQENVTFRIGVMNWQGNAAQAPVEITNTTGAPIRPTELGCDFVSVGRVVGSDRQRVPPLAPGQAVTVSVSSDTGGQLVDSIICRLL